MTNLIVAFRNFVNARKKKRFGECSNGVSSVTTRFSVTLIGCNAIDEQLNAVYITLTALVAYYAISTAGVIIWCWMAGHICCDLTLFLLVPFCNARTLIRLHLSLCY